MTGARQTRCWTAPGPELLLWETWDQGAVLFNLESGQTHYLNPVAEVAIHILQQRPRTAPSLCRLLAEQLEIEATESFQQQVDTLLAQLEGLGLAGNTDSPAPSP